MRLLAQQTPDRIGRHVAFDDIAFDFGGMAGLQGRRHAKRGFDAIHVGALHDLNGKTVRYQIADPGAAATAAWILGDQHFRQSRLGLAGSGQNRQQRYPRSEFAPGQNRHG